MKDDKLHLLLAHDDDGSPVLEDGLPDAATKERDEETSKSKELTNYWEENDDPDDLEAQRWGVIAPEGPEGDRLLKLIRPLIEARGEQQGGDEVNIYRVPIGLSPTEATLWRKTHFDSGTTSSRDIPRYQLILGDLDQVSLGLQHGQSYDGFVGRLSFRDERGYEAYVDKVLRWEKERSEAEGSVKLFTVHDGTAATTIGYHALVKPGLDMLRKQGYGTANLGDPNVPSPSEFLASVASPDPTIMFSMSHGAGAPRAGWKSYEEQRNRQGAMSFGREGKITGDDLNEDPFLPGGLWFMLACYGAGTPNSSAYRHWLEKLKQAGQFGGQAQSVLASLPREGEKPFIAALPQAVLANPSGPLAVIAHIDLAWTYSFEERDTGKAVSRPGKFVETLRSALLGDRVGGSFRALVKTLTLVNYQLTTSYDQAVQKGQTEASDGGLSGHLWMLRQDLSGYILLGDPAARLPISRKRKKKAEAPAAARTPSIGTTKLAEPAEPAKTESASKLPVEIDNLEKAIGHRLAGGDLSEVADKFQINATELQKLTEIYQKAGRAALLKE
jgi:hypothetical protein